MIKCSKCGAVFGKMLEDCFYCGGKGTLEEIDNGEFKEELVKKYEEQPKVEEHTEKSTEEVKEEAPKKKRGRKKKSE